MKRFLIALTLISSAAVSALEATTLAPFTFDDQVSDAADIFRGKVTAINSERRATERGTAIFTMVTFDVLESYKGSSKSPRTLQFLGGSLSDKSMIVEGMPRFADGQELILFVSGEPGLACPVLGWSEGRMTVEGEEVVLPERAQTSASAARARKAIRSDDRMALGEFRQLLNDRLTIRRKAK